MELNPVEFVADDHKVILAQNKPFICRPKHATGSTAALLVHGFTGTPREMSPVAEYLAGKGITSVAVRLPGHGTSPEDLAQRRYEEWIETVVQGKLFLKKEGFKVVAVGLSTGAMVALKTHLSQPFAGLVLLSPYLKVRHRLAPLAGLLLNFVPYQHRILVPEERPYYYSKRPLAGIHQLNRLVRSVRDHLPAIMAPTFIASAEGDQTVDPDSAITLYRQLGSRIKELHRYGPEVPHVMTAAANPKQKELLAAVCRFVETFNR